MKLFVFILLALVSVGLNDGLFGDDGLTSDNDDAEGFEFNFERLYRHPLVYGLKG